MTTTRLEPLRRPRSLKHASARPLAGARRALLLAPLLLTACSTPGYQCQRGEACAPVHNTYRDAVRAQGSWRPVWDVRGHHFGKKPKAGFFSGWFSGWFSDKHKRLRPVHGVRVPGGPRVTAPVYQPPRPWRVWLGPWVDANGDLRSGQYVWFVTPGHWDYAGQTWPLRVRADRRGTHFGNAFVQEGVLAPVPPTRLGFTPSLSQQAPGVLSSVTQPRVVHRPHNGSPKAAQ